MNLEKADFKNSASEVHRVRYYLYPSDIDNVDGFGIPKSIGKRNDKYIIRHGSNICLATLLRELAQNKDRVDRFVYLLENRSISLTQNEISEWLDICTKAKALPKYIKKESDTERNRYILKLESSTKLSMLFIQITCIRWIQEAPIFVKNMIALVNKYHMSFYLAWLVASRMSIGNSWHNIVSDSARYGQTIDKVLKDSTFDVSSACGVRNLILYTDKFDKRSIGKLCRSADFEATEYVHSASPKLRSESVLHIKHMTNNALNKAIKSESDDDLEDVLTELDETK